MNLVDGFAAAAPYLQVGAAGTYLAAAFAMLSGRWRHPQLSHPWFVFATVIAFVAARALPDYAFISAPVTFFFAVLLGAQIFTARGNQRAGLWRALALVPVTVMVLIVAATSFSVADGLAIKLTESALLALAAPFAAIAAVTRRAT